MWSLLAAIGAPEVNMKARLINLATKLSVITALTFLVTACGGGAGTEEGGGTNKPLPVSSSSLAASSITTTSSITKTSSASAKSSSISSSEQSTSSRQTYSRASRAQTSSEDFEEANLPPTQPTNPEITSISMRSIGLKWGAASDDTGVSSYEILRNGAHIGTTTAYTMSFEDNGLDSGTSYSYTVRAVDTSGHRSPLTAPLNTKTLTDTSKASSSKSVSSLSSSSRSTTSSLMSASSLASSRSSGAASSAITSGGDSIELTWAIPNKREDGSSLQIYEIEGYELRHKPQGSRVLISRIISDATIHSFVLDDASREDTFEIAAYDRNGLYSKFVRLTPR